MAGKSDDVPPIPDGITDETAINLWKDAHLNGGAFQDVDEAHILTSTKDAIRNFPLFSAPEIRTGKVLGEGGFCTVSEVTEISAIHNRQSMVLDALSENEVKKIQEEAENQDLMESALKEIVEDDEDDSDEDDEAERQDYTDHYEVETAKKFMVKHCMRSGSARYACKKLRNDLSDLDRVRGMIDLGIEISFLKALWHPNIVKMRGFSLTPRLGPDTFLLLDRLYGTLDDKMDSWLRTLNAHKPKSKWGKFCRGKESPEDKMSKATLEELLTERLLVAYDLAAAFTYMHHHRLVYRDIKAENIGFDIRDDVKVFDFGLSRSMAEKDKNKKGHGYHLTGRTGSIPYMAPEIAKKEPYDQSADVFSFSILLWEIMSLTWAFNGYSITNYYQRVALGGERLPLNKKWPAVLRSLMTGSWDGDPTKRPDMKQIATLIRSLLQRRTNDVAVANRTEHMLDKSERSFRLKSSNHSGRNHAAVVALRS